MRAQAIVNVRLDELAASLGDCLAWCHRWKNAPPRATQVTEVFRSQLLGAAARAVLPESCHTKYSRATDIAFNDFRAMRKKLAASPDASPPPADVQVELNRPKAVIVLDWSSSLFDGAATPETDGFLDDNYIPPWDTWLVLGEVEGAYSPKCLVGWVPSWMSEGMDSAIAIDPASCLSWCTLSPTGELQCRGWGKRWDDPGPAKKPGLWDVVRSRLPW
jgi:hypothetical protein